MRDAAESAAESAAAESAAALHATAAESAAESPPSPPPPPPSPPPVPGSPDVRLRDALLVCLQMSRSGNCQCSDDVPCEYETVPIGRWDVSAVTDMRELFKGTQFNADISGWDTSSVNAMEGMFESTPFNQERQRLGHELGDVDEAHVLERAVQPTHRRLERVACRRP